MISLPKISIAMRNNYPRVPREANEEICLRSRNDADRIPDLEVENDSQSSDDDQFQLEILPIITILRGIGFVPFILPIEHRSLRKAQRGLLHGVYFFITLSFLLLNMLIFVFNMYIVKMSKDSVGFLHVHTMTSVITGLKPFQNIVNLLVFVVNGDTHLHLLAMMGQLDRAFRVHFNAKPNYERAKRTLIAVVVVSFSVPALIRGAQFVAMGSHLGENLLDDVSLILVPVLSVWQLVPLFYFILICDTLHDWFEEIATILKSDRYCAEHSIRFYYKLYLKLTHCSETLGGFLNPFFFFTLAISVLILGLTIYFIGNSESALYLPPDADYEVRAFTYFFIVWAGLQVVAAAVLILGICCAGMRLNEQARAILPIVLSVVPRDDKSRFQVICFSHKVQLHYMWAISVWKTIPIERGLLFTIVGLVSSYAVVLLRLQTPRNSIDLESFEDSPNATS